MKVIHGSNERNVYIAGNEFGETHYILDESYEEAWEDFIMAEADAGNRCDHGGDITDEERALQYDGVRDSTCDCEMTEDGRFVWTPYLWMQRMRLPVGQFYLAGIEQE